MRERKRMGHGRQSVPLFFCTCGETASSEARRVGLLNQSLGGGVALPVANEASTAGGNGGSPRESKLPMTAKSALDLLGSCMLLARLIAYKVS